MRQELANLMVKNLDVFIDRWIYKEIVGALDRCL